MKLLRHCPRCGRYTLEGKCPRCGTPTESAYPPKYSPEDKYGVYRRKAKIMTGKIKFMGALHD